MDYALQAALLGAVMGAVVLAAATIYGSTLPSSPGAYRWWAVSFVVDAVSKGVLLGVAAEWRLDLSDLLHTLSAGLSLCGALSLLGGRVGPVFMVSGLLAALGWAWLAQLVRPLLGLATLPLFGIGGAPLLIGAWGFLDHPDRDVNPGGSRLVALTFMAAGMHLLLTPLLHVHPASATLSFMVSQFLSMVMAVALLLLVARGHQRQAEAEGHRANLLQNRLVDALGSVRDAVALFDSDHRLLTSNQLYRDFLAPAADAIQPGAAFDDILRIEAQRGVVRETAGREEEWIREMMGDLSTAGGSSRELQLWDGRWVSVAVYRTTDGGHLRILRDISVHRQAEAALRDGLAWLRSVMDAVADGILTVDEGGIVLSWNKAAQGIFSYDTPDVVGRPVGQLLADDPDFVRSIFTVGEDGPGRAGFGRQAKGRRQDGSEFPLEVTVTEMHQGELVTFIAVMRDITSRKKVEDALVASEQRFRDLAQSASDWFWEMDAHLDFTFVSGRVRQVLAVGPSVFIGRPFAEFGRTTERPVEWEEQLARMQARQPFRGFVCLQTLPSGETKYVEMAGRPAFDAEGQFAGYRGTATDITPLKRHERELAVQSRLRQAIIDNMGQGVVVFDRTEKLLAVNHQARLLLALPGGGMDVPLGNLEGFLLHLAVHGEFGAGDAVEKMVSRLRRLRRKPNQIFQHARPNGMVLEVRSTAMPGGGLIFTFSDITERKKAEVAMLDAKNQAERGNRAKATFLANISHELRTPLNAIIGFSELMKHEIFGPLEPVSYRTYVDDIHESGMHLLELINDILDMSKAEAGMTDLVETLVDVAEVVRSSLRMMGRRAGTNGVELVDELPQSLPLLRADERRLRQIMLNLVSNAVKFTEEGGTVSVSAWADNAGFHLRVADTGIGMTAEDLERVMEPFVQADTRLSRKYEGTGLGLPLTKALVTAHGGTMDIASAPNVGTTVVARFPPDRIVHAVPQH